LFLFNMPTLEKVHIAARPDAALSSVEVSTCIRSKSISIEGENIQSFKMDRCQQVTSLFVDCPQLSELRVCPCNLPQYQEVIIDLIKDSPKLRELEFQDVPNFEQIKLAVAESLPHYCHVRSGEED